MYAPLLIRLASQCVCYTFLNDVHGTGQKCVFSFFKNESTNRFHHDKSLSIPLQGFPAVLKVVGYFLDSFLKGDGQSYQHLHCSPSVHRDGRGRDTGAGEWARRSARYARSVAPERRALHEAVGHTEPAVQHWQQKTDQSGGGRKIVN